MSEKKGAAIKPDFFMNAPALSNTKKTGVAIGDEEKMLYAMSKSAGWKVFENTAREAMEQLNFINKGAIAQGLPLEEIGRNAIVVSLAQEAIERLLTRVSDAVEACEAGE